MLDFTAVKFKKSYVGGKEAPGVYQKIINEIRPHDIFVSGFLGHCAIMRFKISANINIGIDIDAAVIAEWNDSCSDGVELRNSDFISDIESLINAMGSGKRMVIYCDPPYRMDSIKADRKLYKCTMQDSWHEKFLDLIVKISDTAAVDILVSHYPDKVYEEKLSNWRVVEYYAPTRHGKVRELLFMNYNHTSGKLHDYRYLGDNKDERYNLKHRTVKNLIRKISGYEVRKRQAVIHYLLIYLKDYMVSAAVNESNIDFSPDGK